jgi:class 3 adenylate cyclase/tetratricopeptide (TPR) repeat protein
MWVCASCGQENPDGFKFCGSCGAPLVAPAAAREVRKVVTIVFCDLTGSTALGDRTDPEALRATMRGYYEEMRTILERHGGTVEKFVGDAVMAVFGVPVSREDDALRAVRAAWEMRAAVGDLGLQARIGVNTGEVVAGEGDTLVTGDAVNVAARLEQAAEAGEVLIGTETHRHVRDAATVEPVQVRAKGKPEPIAALRIVDFDLDASGIARRLDTALVGRERELALLRQTYDTAAREQSCHLFTLLGPAGVGKSRLVAELVGDLDATVVRGRCLDYGEGITFWPVIEVLKQLGAEKTVEAIATGSVSSNELFLTARRALEDAAQSGPLVVVFDDIHWGQPTFLDLLDHIADLSRGAPILLLCIARPELLDDRPGWGGGKLNATTALLQPLTAEESNALLEGLDVGDVSEETRARIIDSAGGNPLFVEEMFALAREGGDIHAPSTIQALLQARLDRLGAAERSVIERGAVEGELFHRGAVQELGDGGAGDGLDSHLVGLVRKELIRPERGTLPDDDAYRFRHLLIRDVAYDGLPKETRADLHLRFAEWLSAHIELVELDEIVGYHLEQAARYRSELGKPDADIGRRAAARLGAAGMKAASRDDLPAADNLLARALAFLAPGDQYRTQLVLENVLVLEQIGELDRRDKLIAELEASPDRSGQLHGQIARSEMRIFIDPHGAPTQGRKIADEALKHFTAAGDEFGIARAWWLLFHVEWMGSRADPGLVALEKTREHAERAGARTLVTMTTIYSMGPLMHGRFMPDEVRARLEPLRGRGPIATNTVLRVEAHLLDLEGRYDEALQKHDEANAISAELGLTTMLAVMWQWGGEVLLHQGRIRESVEVMRNAVAELEALGDKSFRSTCLIRLADALYAAGEPGEAEQCAIEGEELGAAEDVINYAYGRSIRARIATDRGELEAAESLARDGVEYAYQTDFPWVHGVAHRDHAYVLAAAGRPKEAQRELQRSIECFESFGNVVEVEKTRALLVEL